MASTHILLTPSSAMSLQWAEWLDVYDTHLQFPAFPGFGNHDGGNITGGPDPGECNKVSGLRLWLYTCRCGVEV